MLSSQGFGRVGMDHFQLLLYFVLLFTRFQIYDESIFHFVRAWKMSDDDAQTPIIRSFTTTYATATGRFQALDGRTDGNDVGKSGDDVEAKKDARVGWSILFQSVVQTFGDVTTENRYPSRGCGEMA